MAHVALTPEEQVRLVERILAGDADAEQDLAVLFRRRVLAMMHARLRDRDAAEEVTQETLMAVITALRRGQLRQAASLAAFVHGIARNLANNHIRTRHDAPPVVEISADFDLAVPPEDFEANERLRLVRQALGQLEATDRTILTRTLCEGLKPGEIAQDLAMSAESVRTRKSRALKKVIDAVQRLSRSTRAYHLVAEGEG